MKHIWMIALVGFLLVGVAGVTVAAVAAEHAARPDSPPDNQLMMVDAQYRLAMALGR